MKYKEEEIVYWLWYEKTCPTWVKCKIKRIKKIGLVLSPTNYIGWYGIQGTIKKQLTKEEKTRLV